METPLEITCTAAHQQLQSDNPPLLVDCREQEEHDRVAIAGSLLLPMSQIATRVAEIEGHKQSPIVVHCHLGMRSAQVANWLREQGFEQAQSMAGGIDKWAQEIEPGMTRY